MSLRIAADHRPAVVALFTNGDRLTEPEVWEQLNDGTNTYADVELALMRLASEGKLRRGEDDRLELNNPDLSNRPEWATRSEFDTEGNLFAHLAVLAQSDQVLIELIEEQRPTVQLLDCQFASGKSWVTFNSPEEALEAAELITAAVKKWREIQAGGH